MQNEPQSGSAVCTMFYNQTSLGVANVVISTLARDPYDII